MTCFYLVKQGYGSLKDIRKLDTKELLDICEYENILRDISKIQQRESEENGTS